MEQNNQESLALQIKAIQIHLEAQGEVHNQMHKVIDLKLTQILEQTTKTNGRVNELERWKTEHELNTEKNLLEYNFIKKYPKLMLLVFVAMIILTIINTIK